MNSFRDKLKDKKRIVIKIGSSSLTHEKTGELNLFKIEKLIRVICDLKGEGKDVVLVSSGAIAAGRQALGGQKRPQTISEKQAYAAVGQARLMMVYQRIFSEYNHIAAQVLLTKDTMTNENSRRIPLRSFCSLGQYRLSMRTIRFPPMRSSSVITTGFLPLWRPSSARIF